jgi:regulator of replication initiation timing
MTERDAAKRLHNLCDWVERRMEESPYDQASWDELLEENNNLRTELAVLRKQFNEQRLIHEKRAHKLLELEHKHQELKSAYEDLIYQYVQPTNI